MQDQNNNFYSGLRELLDLEVMKNYNNAIVRKAFKKIAKPGKQILDFGAGIGTLSNIFRERYNLNPVCLGPFCRQGIIFLHFKTKMTIPWCEGPPPAENMHFKTIFQKARGV